MRFVTSLRRRIIGFLAAGCLAGFFIVPGIGDVARADTRPNIVIYLVDTLRADRLNTYGYQRRQTSPWLDALAREGVLFKRCCAPSPWTMPTVASLFLSQYPAEHRMLGTYDRLPAKADTLAERLKRRGFATYTAFASGFLGPEFALDQGFDHKMRQLIFNGQHVNGLLGRNVRTPMFLYIHTVEPHNPYRYAPMQTPGFEFVSQEHRTRMHRDMRGYKDAGEYDYRKKLSLGTNDRTAEQDRYLGRVAELLDEWNEVYDASVRFADSNMQSVINTLKRRGVWDNTIFIFMADHGEEFLEHGGFLHDQSVYDELMHVPLVMRFPRGQFAGTTVTDVVSLIDIIPTLAEYLNDPKLAADARGQSLMPLIRGEKPEKKSRFSIPGMRINTTRFYRPWEEQRGDINIVVYHGPRWKGVWNVEHNTMELYDLQNDPKEQRNLARQRAELVEAMRAHAYQWYSQIKKNQQETEDSGDLGDETLEALRALGYVSDEDESAANDDAEKSNSTQTDPE